MTVSFLPNAVFDVVRTISELSSVLRPCVSHHTTTRARSVYHCQAKTGKGMKTEKVPSDVGRGRVVVEVGLAV